ncbi:MAG: hypothetical protein PUB39_00745 [Eubacteriales bacterium]|nr:hypothetical protein [Eubacteriales bacterium]
MEDKSIDKSIGESSATAERAVYHLPGLFEFFSFYKEFLPLFYGQRDYFYDWCRIGSIYGAPAGCLWGGGRTGFGDDDPEEVLDLLNEYGISARLTFSNSLIEEEHLEDEFCNRLCGAFERPDRRNGIIIYSDLLLEYIRENYSGFHFISSTTKALTDFNDFRSELDRPEFRYVTADFRLNKDFSDLSGLTAEERGKTEFLVNECCPVTCKDRTACYEAVSALALGRESRHVCRSPGAEDGYRFSKAMKSPAFISLTDIREKYLPLGFSNFKIEGRSLGSALLLEFILYYMTKPERRLEVREELYLTNTLDLF